MKDKFLHTMIDGKTQYLHLLIAERMGLDLTHGIEHIDGNPLNNRRSNLREVMPSKGDDED